MRAQEFINESGIQGQGVRTWTDVPYEVNVLADVFTNPVDPEDWEFAQDPWWPKVREATKNSVKVRYILEKIQEFGNAPLSNQERQKIESVIWDGYDPDNSIDASAITHIYKKQIDTLVELVQQRQRLAIQAADQKPAGKIH